MNAKQRVTISREAALAIIAVLKAPRNRFGKLEPSSEAKAALSKAMQPYRHAIPHGGLDIVDQAQMILSAAIGEKVESVFD